MEHSTYGIIYLRHDVSNHQLRMARHWSVAAIQAENVGNRIVVVIQLDPKRSGARAQADLGQAGTRGHFVDVSFRAGQVIRFSFDQLITKPSLTMPVPVEAGFFVPSTLMTTV
jgi:hypothetical protein